MRELATYGREFTGTETEALRYCESFDEWEGAMNKASLISRHDLRSAEAAYRHAKEVLVNRFLLAVDTRDSKTLFDIASTVEFLKDWRQKKIAQPDLVTDRERLVISFIKIISEHTQTRFSVGQVAAGIESIKRGVPVINLEVPPDGFSKLRRKCERMGLKLAPSRTRGERNNNEKNTLKFLTAWADYAVKNGRDEHHNAKRRTGLSRPVSAKHPVKNRKRRSGKLTEVKK